MLLMTVPLTAVTVQATLNTVPASASTGVYVYVAALVPTAAPFNVHAHADAVFVAAWVAVYTTVAPPTVAKVVIGAMVTPRVTVRVTVLLTANPIAWLTVHTMGNVGPASASAPVPV
jgi:hypothetical protein